MKEINMKVNNMHCAGCENRIKNALMEIGGIEKVEASYQTGIVKVTLNKYVDLNVIEERIDDLGFEVVKEN